MDETDSNKKVYASIAQLCKARSIDRKLIRAASAMGLPGFNTNRTVNWELLEPALKANEDELKKFIKERSMDDLKREEKELSNEIKRLEIKKREGSYVDPEEWYQWHSDFMAKLSNKINITRKHLMSKCSGYETVIDSEMLELFVLIRKELEQCKVK